MSMVSGNNSLKSTDFEYWEFVHCAVCFLPFVPDPTNPAVPPSVPFWLTECGHTVCNNHLNADQSCAPCGAPSIQLVPLQRDMMPPMSDWFRSVPHGLDDIAHAAKFQQENMASLVRFYRRKCSQQHATISKVKAALAENKVLRSQIEQLQHEIDQLRSSAGIPFTRNAGQRFSYGSNRHAAAKTYEPDASRNANGKRPLADNNHNQRMSSPRSIVTPLAPPRLTLPPDRQQPPFPSGMGSAKGGSDVGMQRSEESSARPESSRFAQYAFQPPETPLRAQGLRHQQQPQSHGRQQQHELQESHHHAQGHHQHQQRMPPPPTPGRAHGTAITSQHQTTARGPFRPAGQASMQRARNPQMQMPPPPAPPSTSGSRQHHPSNGLQPQPFPMAVPDTAGVPTAQSSSARLLSNSNANGQFRTNPQTPSNRFFAPHATGSANNVPSRVQAFPGTGSTRAQFFPGRGGG